MNAATALNDVIASPEWFLDGARWDRRQFSFVRATRASLAGAPFLDDRWRERGPALQVRFEEVSLATRPGLEPNFIFHTAFCCSTLLARCLDVPGANLSLKEPTVMPMLSNARRVWCRSPSELAEWRRLFRVALALLGRRFDATEAVTIKPTNQCNNLIVPLREALLDARILLLYSDMRRFIVSIVKRGEAGAQFVRRLLSTFLLESDVRRGVFAEDPSRLSDLQATALVWVIQAVAFADALRGAPKDRVASLDCRVLLNAPGETLAKVTPHLGLRIEDGRIADIVRGPAFQRDSKLNEGFDGQRRVEDTAAVERRLGREIDATIAWVRVRWPSVDPSGGFANAL